MIFKKVFTIATALLLYLLFSTTAHAGSSRYAPKDTISLIVSGSDIGHVLEQVKKLELLVKHQNVRIGDVYVVGLGHIRELADTVGKTKAKAVKDLSPIQRKRILQQVRLNGTPLMLLEKNLKNIGLPYNQIEETNKIVDRLDITSSPTWVVRHHGRDYVFEGFSNPKGLFNSRGEFTRAN